MAIIMIFNLGEISQTDGRPTNLVNLSHPHSAHNAIGREQQESHRQTAERNQMPTMSRDLKFKITRIVMTKNQTMHCRVLHDNLRHTLESN